MRSASRLALSCICAAFAAPIALAHDEPAKEYGRLGTVKFENSCAPEVQAKLTRAVAMLHSFWYVAAEKTFTEVISEDPSCGVATWGLASILMSNPLGGRGATAPQAQKAMAAIELGRVMGAKTERQRDYIEAGAPYSYRLAAQHQRRPPLPPPEAH